MTATGHCASAGALSPPRRAAGCLGGHTYASDVIQHTVLRLAPTQPASLTQTDVQLRVHSGGSRRTSPPNSLHAAAGNCYFLAPSTSNPPQTAAGCADGFFGGFFMARSHSLQRFSGSKIMLKQPSIQLLHWEEEKKYMQIECISKSSRDEGNFFFFFLQNQASRSPPKIGNESTSL